MKTKQLRKRGRPAKHDLIDPGIVTHMVANGARIKDIAKHLKVCVDTIFVRFREAIRQGHALKIKLREPFIAEILEKKRRKLREWQMRRQRKYRKEGPAYLRYLWSNYAR